MKKINAVVFVLVLIVSIGTCTTWIHASNDTVDFLGTYEEYGLIANEINQTADMETNFIAGKYTGNGHTIGNTVSSNMANASGKIRAGEVTDSIQARNNPDIVIDPQIKNEVASLIAAVKKTSSAAFKNVNYALASPKDMNQYFLDISKEKKSAICVVGDSLLDGRLQNGAITIKKRAGQTLVINLRSKSVTIPRYQVVLTDGSNTREELARHIIWNMPDAKNLTIASDGIAATIIAPSAKAFISVTGEGWLLCDRLDGNSGEWHMISHHIPCNTPTPTPGNSTPTPSPAVTPTPSPAVTPTPTPSVTPTPSPVVTPTPSPGVTPTPSPDATSMVTPTVSPATSSTASQPPSQTASASQAAISEKNTTSTAVQSTTDLKTIEEDSVPTSDSPAPDTGDTVPLLICIFLFLATSCTIFYMIRHER